MYDAQNDVQHKRICHVVLEEVPRGILVCCLGKVAGRQEGEKVGLNSGTLEVCIGIR